MCVYSLLGLGRSEKKQQQRFLACAFLCYQHPVYMYRHIGHIRPPVVKTLTIRRQTWSK